METAYPSIFIANKVLELPEASNYNFTPMKLLKMVYLCHGWCLGILGMALIKERVMAWKYGPVIEELYYAIRHYGSMPVKNPIMFESGGIVPCTLSEEHGELIKAVYNKYKHLDGLQLSTITHEKDSPWDRTQNMYKIKTIHNDLIKNFYIEQYNALQ